MEWIKTVSSAEGFFETLVEELDLRKYEDELAQIKKIKSRIHI